MQKLKNLIKRVVKKDSFLYKLIRKIYHILSTFKYKITNRKQIKEQRKHYRLQVSKAIEMIEKYRDKDYIVFYNPIWLGVANSSKGLFENIIPLEHVYDSYDIKNIVKSVNDNNIKTVIFSQICDGWVSIIDRIKIVNPNIKVKVIWHGNCYEFFSDFTWNLNKEVMKLYKEGKIESFGFLRSTMYEFYKKLGYKCFYLQNNVHLENIKKIQKQEDNKVRLGIYNADSRELKNIYTALSAMKLIPNAIADVVPINAGAKEFTRILRLETTSEDDYIPTEKLLERIQNNDINIYPTFTENAPMFPLESFEVGVPCLLGNNNDYFVGTELGDYVILKKEDDSEYIKERALYCIEHRDEIMCLYKKWKSKFNIKCEELVKEFINK